MPIKAYGDMYNHVSTSALMGPTNWGVSVIATGAVLMGPTEARAFANEILVQARAADVMNGITDNTLELAGDELCDPED